MAWATAVLSPYNERPERHHAYLLERLEEVARGECDRLMVFMPPGSAKTRYASIVFPSWFLAQRPGLDVIGASYNAEYAEDISARLVRTVAENQHLLGYRLLNDSRRHWYTTNRCQYRAAGAGGGITGRRADLFVIDDPIKGREDADSETIREKVWKWYRAEVVTRLKPGARIVLIQCMTGDTPVLMADGSETPLRDIRPGDRIATYRDGALAASTVTNHANQGHDDTFAIRTVSGTIAKANERHPFLVERGGERRWIRLRELRIGDALLSARVHGEARPASSRDAANRSVARAIAIRTTTRRDGPMDIALRLADRMATEGGTFDIATGSMHRSTTPSSPRRTGDAPSAENRHRRTTPHPIGADCASTTTRPPAGSGDCSAIAATFWSDTARPRKSCSAPLATYAITPDPIVEIVPAGREEVFDIEVAETGNFIANGLISHNTRWHHDDLAGRLLNEQEMGADQWRVINLPALAEEDDQLGREPGEALWPEWEDVAALERKRAAVGPREWSALFQQRPTPAEGAFFKPGLMQVHDAPPACTHVVRSWDLASSVSSKGSSDPDWTRGLKVGRTAHGAYVLLDLISLRGGPDEVLATVVNTAKADGRTVQVRIPEDPGQAGKMQALHLTRYLAGFVVKPERETGDKVTRAGPVASQVNIGNFGMVRAHWNGALVEELAAFPAGTHDDIVDALSGAFAIIGLGTRPVTISAEAISRFAGRSGNGHGMRP